MQDYILRATTKSKEARIFIATSKETANRAFEIHKTSPVVSNGLSRLLTATAIIGTMLKNDKDCVTINITGDGPMKGLLATGDNKGRVKGYPKVPMVDIQLKENGKSDLRNAIGEGTLTLIQDTGLKEPYVGQIPLISGEIADDLTYYYAKSEQIPTAISLGVSIDIDYTVKNSGGFLLQMLPEASQNIVERLEKKMQKIPPITKLYDNNKTPYDILEIIFGDIGYTIMGKSPIEYYCNCSKERAENILLSIGKKELLSILNDDKQANIHCHFCNNNYLFVENELEKLINQIEA